MAQSEKVKDMPADNRWIEILCEEAKKHGLTEYEIYSAKGESLSCDVLEHELNSFSSSSSGGISFRCRQNGRMGYASTERTEEEDLRDLVIRAIRNSEIIEETEGPTIYGGSDNYANYSPAAVVLPEAEDMKKEALELQEKLYASDAAVSSGTQSGITAYRQTYHLVNSYGLKLSNTVGGAFAFVDAVLKEGEESNDAFAFAEYAKEDEVLGLPKKVLGEAHAKFRAQTVPSGTYDILLEARQMTAILAAFSPVFSGKNALMGLSLLAGKEQTCVASSCVTLWDDPMPKGSSIGTSFDGEGAATGKKSIILEGILNTLLYDRETAAKCRRQTTGNGQRPGYSSPVSIAPFSFSFEPGKDKEAELIQKIQRGLYITEIKGLHAGANAVTGDFSVESAGQRIEDGRLAGAVKTFTISGNFFDLLKKIEAFSDTVYWGIPSGMTRFGAPSAWIKDISVAGT